MANRQAFGRRISPQVQTAPVRVEPVAENVAAPDIPLVEEPLPLAPQEVQPSVEDELREWKLSRRKSFEVPWSQLSLVASLCFGIASLILPDSVNDNVQWLLYALMAASAWVAYSKRRRKPAT
jgi:hypothetical protein